MTFLDEGSEHVHDRAAAELGGHVRDVVRGRDYGLKAAGLREVVVQGLERLDLGHGRRRGYSTLARARRPAPYAGASSASGATRCAWTQMTAPTTSSPPAICTPDSA